MSRFKIGGPLRYKRNFYIQRQAEQELCSALKQGESCCIAGPSQLGKTSLLRRVEAKLRDDNISCIYLSLDEIGQAPEEQWFYTFSYLIRTRVGNMEQDATLLFPMQKCLHQFNQLLETAITPIVILIDEVNAILELEFSDEFFSMIYEIYKKYNQRIIFCLAGIFSFKTPFKIISLNDFTLTETNVFAPGLQNVPGDTEAWLQAIYYWTAGHPYMTQRLCYELSLQAKSLAKSEHPALIIQHLVDHCFFNKIDFSVAYPNRRLREIKDTDFLRQILSLYSRIVDGEVIDAQPSDPAQMQLYLTGLIRHEKTKGNTILCIRNRIIKRFYDRNWIQQELNIL